MTRMIAAAARLFGYDPARAEHYPLRWSIVLGITLAAARAVAALAGIFAGAWSLLIVPVAWVMLSRFVFNWSEQRRRNALYAQFPDALAMIVRARARRHSARRGHPHRGARGRRRRPRGNSGCSTTGCRSA